MLVVVVFLAYGLVQVLSRTNPVVSTKLGLIGGRKFGEGYNKFLGIPYAVVDKRHAFGPATTHPGFNAFKAIKSTVCPQLRNSVPVGTIDCLTLDIYVPTITRTRLPVMVWIHGGGFVAGSSTKAFGNPEILLRHDVIVVAINYRLGAYGFMCLGIPEVPGNQGLKDQVMALRWINENIEAFGGNPKEITVFGESAGGISVSLHLLSSYEKLFQRAIIQSGSAFSHVWTKEFDTTVPIKLARELAYITSDINKALEYLSFIDPRAVIKAAHNLSKNNGFENNNTLKGPCIERELADIDYFITKYSTDITSPKVKTTPVMIGFNSNESAVVFEVIPKFYENFNIGDHLKLAFNFNSSEVNYFDDAVEVVRVFYVGKAKSTTNIKKGLMNFLSDFYFNYPAQKMADLLVESSDSDVYGYIFSYSGGRNLMKVPLNMNSKGATHGDELIYLLDYSMFGEETTPEDEFMVDRMTTMWTNFAKFGDPTPSKSTELPIEWKPITKTINQYLDINFHLSLVPRPFHKRMAFWDRLYKHYQKSGSNLQSFMYNLFN